MLWTTYNSSKHIQTWIDPYSPTCMLYLISAVCRPPLATVRTVPVDTSTGGSVDLMSVATGGSAVKAGVQTAAVPGGPYMRQGMRSLFMQVSLVFLLISGFYAMVS
jgi:hypothetical protein